MNDRHTINVMKGLIIDGVHQANSGHPGGAMSSIDFAYILFSEFLNFDPQNPQWENRDRFVLSAGHESMLLYTLLHFNGWLPMDELKRFRQLHSKTPGHPENTLTTGVECTTGPLGQGAAMSVGMAAAERHLRESLGSHLQNHRTYCIVGDGCIQEDVTLGAASLAGHWGLDQLIWYYDRNRIQISGEISRATSDDETKIFEGFGWNVLHVDGHDLDAIRQSIQSAQANKGKPTLIIGNTTIAKGAHSMEGSHKTHGAPLPAEERRQTKAALELPEDEDFHCPESAINHYRRRFEELTKTASLWRDTLSQSCTDNKTRQLWDTHFGDELPALPALTDTQTPKATRNVFGELLEQWCEALPQLFGGSADLEPSNMTGAFAKKVGDFLKDSANGRNLVFGVREFPMSAICNGIALHGGLIPFDATFLTFSDYSRAALRLGAIQKVRVIHEFSHDSFHLGEDGPTHQPVEHVMSLRTIPDFYVMRPADAAETEAMCRTALHLQAPTAICLTRQKVPPLPAEANTATMAQKGAYVVLDAKDPEYVIMATGSEVALALEVAKGLNGAARVISMPCWELFMDQDESYRNQVLAPQVGKRISIEAGVTLGWQKFTGTHGLNIGIDHFGDSAPAGDLAETYGFTAAHILKTIAEHRFS